MMLATQSTVVLDDGATTTLEQWGTSGSTILCVHGMVSSRKSWARFAQRFGTSHRVLAYDQRGHGNSASVHGPMTLERGVRDLENVVGALGAVDVILGHSWGGAVAIRGGETLDVRAVAAIDPMIVQAGKDWYDEYVAELDETFALQGDERDARVRDDFSDWHPLDVEGKVHAMHAMSSAPIAGLSSENIGGTWDLRSEVARYSKPLLLAMAGRENSILPPEIVDEVRAHHARSVTVVSFDDQGHNVHRTAFDRFADAFEAFLAETLV